MISGAVTDSSTQHPSFELEHDRQRTMNHLGHDHAGHRPYWKRAHHDWRFWVGILSMLLAISLYVVRDQSVYLPRKRSQSQAPVAIK